MNIPSRTPVLVAGPTASGKSALALALAERIGGWVVNADSMQVYSGWQILTARPDPAEIARAPHRLYGHIDPTRRYSVGDWLREVTTVLAEARDAGATPVIVGGTGLNFTALTGGLSPIPPIPNDIRKGAEAKLAADGAEAFRRDLLARDPAAARLDIENPRRMLRAWEVLETTGRSITDWARDTPPPLLPLGTVTALAIEADRDSLLDRIDRRFDAMLGAGMVDEVAAMRDRGLDPSLPAMKAVGAPPLMAHLAAEMTLDAAVTRARIDTRRYAKRQRTWLRNQMAEWTRIPMGASVETVLKML